MRDSGVHKEAVFAALRATPGLTVHTESDGAIVIIKDGKIDVLYLDEIIEKKMLFRLEYRYQTPIHWFYRTDMIPAQTPRERVQ